MPLCGAQRVKESKTVEKFADRGNKDTLFAPGQIYYLGMGTKIDQNPFQKSP